MYKVSDVAKMVGISARTIRYYDEIDLFKPSEVSEGGYRLYTDKDLDKLQQILFYKNLGMSLYEISESVKDEKFDLEKSLKETLEKYVKRKKYIESVIQNIENSIEELKKKDKTSKTKNSKKNK